MSTLVRKYAHPTQIFGELYIGFKIFYCKEGYIYVLSH